MVAAGVSPLEFYKLTPGENTAIILEFMATNVRQQKRSIETAWYSAAFTNSKRLPKLKNLLKTLRRHKRAREAPELTSQDEDRIRSLTKGLELSTLDPWEREEDEDGID